MRKIFVVVISLSLLLSGTLIAVGGEMTDRKEYVDENIRRTESEPKEIHDWHDLYKIRNDLSAEYILMNNLDEDTEGYEEYNDPNNQGWEPIGHDEHDGFDGKFYGDYYVISDLYIDRPEEEYVGLFAGSSGMIESVGIVNAYIIGYSRVGPLVGHNMGVINNSFASGDVEGEKQIGGLVGWNGRQLSTGYIFNSYANTEVKGVLEVGGLVGRNEVKIEKSYAEGDVSGTFRVGGLSGVLYYGSDVEFSNATGDVIGENMVGGFAGYHASSELPAPKIYGCYAEGDVIGEEKVGGFVGHNNPYASIYRAFATGEVEGKNYVGGFAGFNDGKINETYGTGGVEGDEHVGGLVGLNDRAVNNSFWDIETSGQNESEGGTGKTTVEMKDVATYTVISTEGLEEPWDFVADPYDDESDEDIWDIDLDGIINDGYPFFSWNKEVGDYELTVHIEGQGSVDIKGQKVGDGWSGALEEGENVELLAVPSEYWYFEGWTGDYEDKDEEITITMDSDKEITAHFEETEELEEYTLTLNEPIGGGILEVDGHEVTEWPYEEVYKHDTEVELKAVPEEGWNFNEWTGDYEGDEQKITVTMDSDKEITAWFEEEIEEDDTPGFTMTLLLLAVIISVAIYKMR